jgi:hypothetical protein
MTVVRGQPVTTHRTTLSHYEVLERSAAVDCARVLRGRAKQMERMAQDIEDGGRVNTGMHRADLREIEEALLAYDKARAALEAIRVETEVGDEPT